MKLLVDAMLGRLSRYLRMCGYDAAYVLDRGVEDDDRIRAVAEAEGRRLVTRDTALVARTDDAILIESREIDGQLRELVDTGLELTLTSPERCGRCNGLLEPVDDEETPPYAPDPGERDVWRCPGCGQHFWCGSHWADVRARLAEL